MWSYNRVLSYFIWFLDESYSGLLKDLQNYFSTKDCADFHR